jgi:hypothetical protein
MSETTFQRQLEIAVDTYKARGDDLDTMILLLDSQRHRLIELRDAAARLAAINSDTPQDSRTDGPAQS